MNEYVTGGTFWFALALINAGLAEQKSRSRWNWFLLSLLLGPIATLYIVAWPTPEEQRAEDEARAKIWAQRWVERKRSRAARKAAKAAEKLGRS